MERVLVLDRNQQPLKPCRLNRVRLIINPVKIGIFRHYPLTIILKELINCSILNNWLEPIVKKPNPPPPSLQGKGVREILLPYPKKRGVKQVIKNGISYDKNRTIENSVVLTWVKKISNFAPSNAIYQESVRFDTQLRQNPDLTRIDYKQGELFRRLKYPKSPVETNTVELIEFNLYRQTLEKDRWLNAGHVGKSPPVKPQITGIKPLLTERTAIAMLPRLCPQQLYHLGRPQNQTASPIPATAKLSKAMVDVSMGEER